MTQHIQDIPLSAGSVSSIDGVGCAEGSAFANSNNLDRAIAAMIRNEFAAAQATLTASTLVAIAGIGQFGWLSGASTIQGFGTAVTGLYREMLALSTLILAPTTAMGLDKYSANISLEPGALVKARSLGAGNWSVKPERATGLPMVNPTDITGIGKHVIPVNIEAFLASTTNGPGSSQVETTTNKINFKTLDYDASTAETAWLKFIPPSSADESRGFTFEYDWRYGTTGTGTGIAMSLSILALSDGDAEDTAPGTAVTLTDAKLGSGVHHMSAESATVTPSGSWAAGDELMIRLARVPTDAADLLTADAQIKAVRLFMYTDAATDTA